MSRLWSLVDRRAVIVSDGIATVATLVLVGLLAMWLEGCAEVGQFSADDAQNAASIAAAVGDSAGSACWPVLEATGNAISAARDKPGILVAIEEKRAVQMALQNAICQSVWAGVLAELLKATPVAPFVP
jgi:hypothetical protein